MSKQQKKLEKKRTRERDVKTKLRLQRAATRKKAKDERSEAVEQRSYNKMIKERIQLEQWAKTVEGKLPEELSDRITNNIAVLKALEAEHAAEQQAKQEARKAHFQLVDPAPSEEGLQANAELSPKIFLDAQVS